MADNQADQELVNLGDHKHEKDLERTKNKIQSNSTYLSKTIQVNGKMKVVLLSKENMKKKPKSAQKIHFLFTIIAAKTVKTHKKIEKYT